jgi:hypothetical protein
MGPTRPTGHTIETPATHGGSDNVVAPCALNSLAASVTAVGAPGHLSSSAEMGAVNRLVGPCPQAPKPKRMKRIHDGRWSQKGRERFSHPPKSYGPAAAPSHVALTQPILEIITT